MSVAGSRQLVGYMTSLSTCQANKNQHLPFFKATTPETTPARMPYSPSHLSGKPSLPAQHPQPPLNASILRHRKPLGEVRGYAAAAAARAAAVRVPHVSPPSHFCNNKCRHGYALRNVFMLGFSQGGTVALSVLQSLNGAPIGTFAVAVAVDVAVEVAVAFAVVVIATAVVVADADAVAVAVDVAVEVAVAVTVAVAVAFAVVVIATAVAVAVAIAFAVAVAVAVAVAFAVVVIATAVAVAVAVSFAAAVAAAVDVAVEVAFAVTVAVAVAFAFAVALQDNFSSFIFEKKSENGDLLG